MVDNPTDYLHNVHEHVVTGQAKKKLSGLCYKNEVMGTCHV